MSIRSPADLPTLLARAIALYARTQGHACRPGEVTTRPWASATFEGEQVSMELYEVDPDAAWLSELPEADLPIRGYYVADLLVRPLTASAVRIEALLLLDL